MTKRSTIIAAVVAIAVIAIIALSVGRRSTDTPAASGTPADSTTAVTTTVAAVAKTAPNGSTIVDPTTIPTSDPTVTVPTTTADPQTPTVVTPPPTQKPVPIQATLSQTSGLSDGSPITIHIAPDGGSQAFGFEARLCRADATYVNDSDMRPAQSGKCLDHPFSSKSDAWVQVDAKPPYSGTDGTFRVGVGTETFDTVGGKSATISCGQGHPCVLVLKLQYPNGFGFKVFPLNY